MSVKDEVLDRAWDTGKRAHQSWHEKPTSVVTIGHKEMVVDQLGMT